MAENVIQYTVTEGERWDMVALKCYGRADMMNAIIAANPNIPAYDVLPGGIVLDVPIIDSSEVVTDAEKMPPWKRNDS